MVEISTIYQPTQQQRQQGSAVTTPTPTQTSTSTSNSTTSSTSSSSSGYILTPDTLFEDIPLGGGDCTNNRSRRLQRRSPRHDGDTSSQQGRAYQVRQGAFKLNSLRLPSTVARFVIMQVIFSIGCAVLGILAVAFRCWMAYLCIPVIVGAIELFIGILGYTAIKRPRKKALVKCYFIGCLSGSIAGLGLVVFSIIAAATEDEYACYLLPNVVAECTVVRGARFAIELTTVVIGIFEIVVTQVMFMIMCYGSCSHTQVDDTRTRNRSRAPRPNLADDIPANLELPSYDDHHNYPTSPFHDGSYFISSISTGGFEPPSYTNIGLVNDEVPGGIAPFAAALGASVVPAEPPPPYSLIAPGMLSTPLVARNTPSQGNSATGAGDASLSGPAVSNHGIIQALAEPPASERLGVSRGEDVRASGRSVPGFAAQRIACDPLLAWRDRAIHQSLRLSLEQGGGGGGGWGARPAHQHQHQHQQSTSSEEDPTILPPELYRDEIRRSGHRYSLSDPMLQSRNARNRPRQQLGETLNTEPTNSDERTTNAASTVVSREIWLAPTVRRSTPPAQTSSNDQEGDSPRRRPAYPPPYEGQHNIVRTQNNVANRANSENRQVDNHSSDESHTYDTCGSRNGDNLVRQSSSPGESRQQRHDVVQRSRTLPSHWRATPEDAIYETIPSPDYSPVHQQRSPARHHQDARDQERLGTDAAESSGEDVDGSDLESNVSERCRYERSYTDNVRVTSGSRSWDASAGQDQRLPDVVGGPRSPGGLPARDEPSGESEGGSPSRQPPPYHVRRMPSHSPPPYRRNQSLPGYARRPNPASMPPPYQGHQQHTDSSETDRSRSNQRRVQGNDSRRNNPGQAVREMTELSDRISHRQSEEQRERREVRNPIARRGIDSSFSIPRPMVSHTMPRVSVSAVAISPPSAPVRRISAPPSSRQHAMASSSGVIISPSRITFMHSSSEVRTTSSSSSSAAVTTRSEQEQSRISCRRTGQVSTYASTSSPSRDHRAGSPENTTNQSRREQTRPTAAVRSPPKPAPRTQPLHPRSSSHPPIRPRASITANSSEHSSQRPVPLHPRSLSEASPQNRPASSDARDGQPSRKPQVPPRSRVDGRVDVRVDGKPAAEIHPFRTVKSTPVKPQRVFVATKALANALQKGHLNDLLDEYEETII